MIIFNDRADAGKQLADKLLIYKSNPETIVVALPRGGVAVGFEIAQNLNPTRTQSPLFTAGLESENKKITKSLRIEDSPQQAAGSFNLPLDILASRKIGMPGNPEFAVGAVSFDGQLDLNEKTLKEWGIAVKDLQGTIQFEKEEAIRRMRVYRQGCKPINFETKTVILVDDGIVTGATAIAAIKSLRQAKVKLVALAVPVLPAEEVSVLSGLCEKLVFLQAPQDFEAIGAFYRKFPQLSDAQVVDMLNLSTSVA